jgi:hypothetical protein
VIRFYFFLLIVFKIDLCSKRASPNATERLQSHSPEGAFYPSEGHRPSLRDGRLPPQNDTAPRYAPSGDTCQRITPANGHTAFAGDPAKVIARCYVAVVGARAGEEKPDEVKVCFEKFPIFIPSDCYTPASPFHPLYFQSKSDSRHS